MDLRLFSQVLWRFKPIVLVGLVVAVALATLSIARIGPHGLTYRRSLLWESTTRLGVTSQGSNWSSATSTVDLTGRTMLLAQLVDSDPVTRLIRQSEAPKGQVGGTIVTTGWGGSINLPLLDITAVSGTPAAAAALASSASRALQTYLGEQQRVDGVSRANRVVLTTVQAPSAQTTTIFRGRSKTIPILVFGVVMFATVGLAFLLENLRPRLASPRELAQTTELPARRTA